MKKHITMIRNIVGMAPKSLRTMKPNIDCDPIPWLGSIAEKPTPVTPHGGGLYTAFPPDPYAANSPARKVHESVIKVNVAQLPVTLN
jgi:hypothetical protein